MGATGLHQQWQTGNGGKNRDGAATGDPDGHETAAPSANELQVDLPRVVRLKIVSREASDWIDRVAILLRNLAISFVQPGDQPSHAAPCGEGLGATIRLPKGRAFRSGHAAHAVIPERCSQRRSHDFEECDWRKFRMTCGSGRMLAAGRRTAPVRCGSIEGNLFNHVAVVLVRVFTIVRDGKYAVPEDEMVKRVTGTNGNFDRESLQHLIDEAIVDCYNEYEQAVGMFVKIEDNLSLPFTTRVLGSNVQVVAIEQDDNGNIMAVCERKGERQHIPLAELPLPFPPPEGAEWIAAYRLWARHIF